MAAETPHFDLPFRFRFGQVAVAEQDSLDDVANCVTAIVSTHVNWRDEVPSFGIVDLALRKQPLDGEGLRDAIEEQEPRATATIRETPSGYDNLMDVVNVKVGAVGGVENAN